MTMECEGFSTLKNEPKGKQVSVCPTLTARDYKGLNNYGQAGIVEAVRLTDCFREEANAEPTEVCPTLMARDYKGLNNHGIGGAIECIRLGGLNGKRQAGSIYSPEGCSPTLVSGMSHWTNVPNIVECEKVEQRIVSVRGRSKSNPNFRGKIDKDDYVGRLEPNQESICNTLTTVDMDNMVLEISQARDLSKWVWEIDGEYFLIRLRRLTPKESWRLMGFTDEDYEKASSVCSNTQLFKQAGNSIVKQVLMACFKEMM